MHNREVQLSVLLKDKMPKLLLLNWHYAKHFYSYYLI